MISRSQSLADDPDFMDAITSYLDSISDRSREVFCRRAGYLVPRATLQEIAADSGVSRERIRQIESKILREIRGATSIKADLSRSLSESLDDRLVPLPLAGISIAHPYFLRANRAWSIVEYLLNAWKIPGIFTLNIDDIVFLSRIDLDIWEHAVHSAATIINTGAEHDLLESDCQTAVYNLLPPLAQEFRFTLWTVATRHSHFIEGEDGQRILVADGRGAQSVVEAVLTASGEPLHYSEIARRAERDWGRYVDPRRAHSVASELGILLARGVYGLPKHLAASENQLRDVAEKAENLLLSTPTSRQWHTKEILEELSDNDELLPEGLDIYVLDYALRFARQLKRLRRMVWAADTAAAPTANERITLHQSIVSILEAAGHPLSTDEIRTRLGNNRGVGDYFQIFHREPLVRLGPNFWGLNDRDIIIKRNQQRVILDNLLDLLQTRKIAFHVSEIPAIMSLPEDYPELPAAICSIAASDPRFRLGRGQYLFPSIWPGPNRPTTTSALRQVLANASRPMDVPELLAEIENALGRSYTPIQLYGVLRAVGAVYDKNSETWSLGESDSDTED